MSTTFGEGPTRDVQPGDTPDLNDGLLSRLVADSINLERGIASVLVAGKITVATPALVLAGNAPFVPIESVDNTGGGLSASGVTAPQRIAITFEADASNLTIDPGDYLKISDNTDGRVEKWIPATDEPETKYARFLGIEAGLLDRAGSPNFDETLTPGIVPDQSVTLLDTETAVIWVQLLETTGVEIT